LSYLTTGKVELVLHREKEKKNYEENIQLQKYPLD